MTFTRNGFYMGIKAGIPIAFGVAAYGVAFGILSRQTGMETWQALLMSSVVFAGASQFVAMDMWMAPLPVMTLIVTTFVVNIRHILMGSVLSHPLKQLSGFQKAVSLFFLVDENWAYSMTEWKKGNTNSALLAGTGLTIFLSWVISTGIGSVIGSGDIDPVRWGIDFAFTAIFIFLATGMWQGRKDLIPWCVAGAAAILTASLFPGKWYILAGSLAGSITGALINEP